MRSNIVQVCLYGAGLVLVVIATAVPAFAGGPTAVPEIDGSAIGAGLAGLSAAALILRSRRRAN